MSEEQQQRTNSPGLERHIQTVLTALAVMLLGWVGMTLVDTRSSLVTLSAQVGFLKEQITDLRTTLSEEKLDNKATLKEHDIRIKQIELQLQQVLNQPTRSKP